MIPGENIPKRHLRSILLNLHYRLSDNDRERLHFYLKNDVPRQVGDDSTLGGTLRLMQSLFDQDKINERDFTLLIDAFKQIQCFDAANLLEEHQRQMLVCGFSQSTQSLTSIMPSHIQEFLDAFENDQISTDNLILNRMKTNKHTQTTLPSRKQLFCISFSTNKYIFLAFILFILTFGILIIMLIERNNRINHLKNNLRMKETYIPKTQYQNNQIEKQLFVKNGKIEELNKTLVEIRQRTKTTLIRAGRRYGSDSGDYFDDSLLPKFTTSYYLREFLFSDINHFNACQFIYTSSQHNQSHIESNIYGGYGHRINSIYKYRLDDDERIQQVHIKSTLISNNIDTSTKKIIRGLKFTTTKHQIFPPNIILTGDDVESEDIPGYTLGYVTGKADQYINQLQFFWYRTEQ